MERVTDADPAVGYPDDNPKTAAGVQKLPLHLVPPVAKAALATAFEDGARKYGPYNWREKKVSASIYYAAAMRHMDAWWDGEDFSTDAGVHHIAHAMACMAIIMDGMSIGMLNDDRPPAGASALVQLEYAENKKNKEVAIVEADYTVEPDGLPDIQEDVRTGN